MAKRIDILLYLIIHLFSLIYSSKAATYKQYDTKCCVNNYLNESPEWNLGKSCHKNSINKTEFHGMCKIIGIYNNNQFVANKNTDLYLY